MARVHGRKMRHIDPNNRLHRLGNKNTTGAYGEVSTWNVRVSYGKKLDPNADPEMAAQIPILTGRPGKRRSAKKKNVSRMYAGKSHVHFDRASSRQLYNLRADMLTLSIVGEISGRTILPENSVQSLMEITSHLIKMQTIDENRKMHEADRSRYFSIAGMVRKKHFDNAQPIRELWNRIERALFQIREKPERKPLAHEFHPEPTHRYVM